MEDLAELSVSLGDSSCNVSRHQVLTQNISSSNAGEIGTNAEFKKDFLDADSLCFIMTL
jgi:hypothetical protein